MPLVAGTPSVPPVNNFNVFEAIGPITITGSYVTNGVTFDLTPTGVPSNSLPIEVTITEVPASGVVGSGYNFVYALGTTIANGVIQAFSTGGTQAAVATFASLNIASLTYRAVFRKFS
jgi:hypothetical protein